MPVDRPAAVARRQWLVVAVVARPRTPVAPRCEVVASAPDSASAPSPAPPLAGAIVAAGRPLAFGGPAAVVVCGLGPVGDPRTHVEIGGLQVVAPGVALGSIVGGAGQAAGGAPAAITFAFNRLALAAAVRLPGRPAVVAAAATTSAASAAPATAARALAAGFGPFPLGPSGPFPAFALRLVAAGRG